MQPYYWWEAFERHNSENIQKDVAAKQQRKKERQEQHQLRQLNKNKKDNRKNDITSRSTK